MEGRPGLKGGAPAEVAPVRHASRRVAYETMSSIERQSDEFPSRSMAKDSPKAFRSAPMQFDSSHVFDESSIVPIKSFDYSQFYEGGNDMLPDSRYDDVPGGASPKAAQQQPLLFHGIPTFLPFFANIKVRHVSAHPLGAHVLLISQPGILYSYGLNIHGQLGIGILSSPRDVHQGYVMKPTVVTPLLENGGKAVVCAAGVTHSLVVVEMEEERIQKARFSTAANISSSLEPRPDVLRMRHLSSDSSHHSTRSSIVKHHQVYGFGRNDHLKMGLVSPKEIPPDMPTLAPYLLEEMECVPLPRRVALRCSVVYPSKHWISDISSTEEDAAPPMGIFAIAASVEHSAALVRRTSGDVALYTWGNATFGALGLPEPETLDGTLVPTSTAFCIVPVPTLVAGLSQSANPEVLSQSLLRNGEFPAKVSLSRCCSFVVTNMGRCFSFGTSEGGMLGLGRDVIETHTPMEIALPGASRGERIVSVSAGALHASVGTSIGNVYSWGARGHCGFPIQRSTPATPVQQPRKPPTMKGPTPIEELMQFEWSPRQVLCSSLERSRSTMDPSGRNESDLSSDPVKIVLVHAGHDCSFFVTERGVVLSSGKASGRLGQGETDHDVTAPKPLFGGLHLFQQENHPIRTHPSSNGAALATKFVHGRRFASA
jgi:alpha-tubulin suppressor-like RCC1 family protein